LVAVQQDFEGLLGTVELAVVGIAGSGFGAALGAPMIWARPGRSAGVQLMGSWLLSLSALVGIISARLIGWLPDSELVAHSINLLGLSAYPLLFLYLWEQTRTSVLRARAWWLWIPAAVYAAVTTIRTGIGGDTAVPFAWMLPVLLLFTGACAVLVIRRERAANDEIVPARWIVGALVVLNLAQVARMLFGNVAPVPAIVPVVITLEFVAMVGVVMWRSLNQPATAATVGGEPRYEKSGLDADAAATLVARIQHTLTTERLFADGGLTLSRLAAAVESTPHQVSEVLNRHLKVTFHELLNRYRVEDVKVQLRDPAADGYTVEGIGVSAGFGSRSALYAAFRRLEGMTPIEFRKRRS